MIGISTRLTLNMLSAAIASCIGLAACGGGSDTAIEHQEVIQSSRKSANAFDRNSDVAVPRIRISKSADVTPEGLLYVEGTAAASQGIAQVTWVDGVGGTGSATVTADKGKVATWTASGLQLQPGDNWLTFTAMDRSGNKSSSQMSASFSAPEVTAALLPLPMPAWNQVSGTLPGTWDGESALVDTTTGTTLLDKVADPKGSGKSVHLRRILKNAPLISGGVRAENAWSSADYSLVPGTDYWLAFAVMIKADEAIPGADSGLLVFQTHTPAVGSTNPDIALILQGNRSEMRWNVAYNTYPSNTWKSAGGVNPDTEALTAVSTQELPKPGTWTRFIVHYRPGYKASHNPIFEVWQASAGESYVKLFSHTGFNTYNSLSGPSYPRLGPYRWSGSEWASASMAFYQTPLFFGRGTNLYASAVSALAGF